MHSSTQVYVVSYILYSQAYSTPCPIFNLSWWPYFFFHWQNKFMQKNSSGCSQHLRKNICAQIFCLLSCDYRWVYDFNARFHLPPLFRHCSRNPGGFSSLSSTIIFFSSYWNFSISIKNVVVIFSSLLKRIGLSLPLTPYSSLSINHISFLVHRKTL